VNAWRMPIKTPVPQGKCFTRHQTAVDCEFQDSVFTLWGSHSKNT
jgi:hypothetical protein